MPLEPSGRFPIRVVARADRRSIDMAADGTLIVRVTEPPHEGKANAAVIAALAKHFRVPQHAISIVQGATRRHKLVEISLPSRSA